MAIEATLPHRYRPHFTGAGKAVTDDEDQIMGLGAWDIAPEIESQIDPAMDLREQIDLD